METERIKSPEGVRTLMAELWANLIAGKRSKCSNVYMVDFPEPTEEEKREMTINRANRKPVVIDEKELKVAIDKAATELGGW